MSKKKKNLPLKYSVEEWNYLDKNNFFYIQAKAEIILSKGVTSYLKNDFINNTLKITLNEVKLIENGCAQIILGSGMFEKHPIQDIGVSGINLLMKTFHFEPKSRKTKYGFKYNDRRGALDQLEFYHLINNRKIIIYNLCTYDRLYK